MISKRDHEKLIQAFNLLKEVEHSDALPIIFGLASAREAVAKVIALIDRAAQPEAQERFRASAKKHGVPLWGGPDVHESWKKGRRSDEDRVTTKSDKAGSRCRRRSYPST